MFDYRNLKDFDRDDLLKMLGVQRRRSTADYLMPALGLFGAGLLIGAGVALLYAPQSGDQLRKDLSGKLHAGEHNGHAKVGNNGYAMPGVEKSRTL